MLINFFTSLKAKVLKFIFLEKVSGGPPFLSPVHTVITIIIANVSKSAVMHFLKML